MIKPINLFAATLNMEADTPKIILAAVSAAALVAITLTTQHYQTLLKLIDVKTELRPNGISIHITLKK